MRGMGRGLGLFDAVFLPCEGGREDEDSKRLTRFLQCAIFGKPLAGMYD
jgi:hypothetical protein